MRPETKYKGSIKLSAIGDALGWITEFEKSPKSLKEKIGIDRIDSFHTWKKNVGGRFYGFIDTIKAGSYSDDTQLLLAVARSIKKDGSLDNDYFSKIELANWLYYARGGGRTVKVAADKIQRKSIKWFNNFYSFKIKGESYDYRQSGANGAAMRVLPIALANLGNIEKINEQIFCNSIVTHGHPRAILGAMLYGYAINVIIVYRPEDFNWENYIAQIGIGFSKKFELTFVNRIEIREWLNEWDKSSTNTFASIYSQTIIETQNQLRFIFQSIKQNISVYETLQKIGCFDPATKGSGVATVIAGIYLAAKFHNSPLEAIITSINAFGADTDSIAAFTGGLVGALHGSSIIPEKWKSVQDSEYLDKIAERLLAISEDRFEESSTLNKTKAKQLISSTNNDFVVGELIEFFPLGSGKITFLDRQPTLTKGKYNLLIEIELDSGQSILISKLLDDNDYKYKLNESSEVEILLELAEYKLKPKAMEKVRKYVGKQKKLSKEQLEIITIILKNEE